ncbi:MAG TPA: HAMP domain-containing sensor histidine kinase, partial [Chitinophaga sp.]|uniref:sensor histidine kinase n=1 Tax=Chitinophaga sp. TaxID=1869181 RepID=UPI002BE8F3C4
MKTGLLKSVFDKLLSPGTSELEKPAEKNPVRIVNGIALTMCFLVMSVGFSFYCLNRSPLILYPVIIETLCFLSVLGLNHLEKYFRANLAMLVIHVIFAVYWSIVLGAAIQMELLIAFLALIVFHLSSAFVIYNERKVLIYCLAGTVVLMVGVQVNNHYALLKPLSFGPDIANVVRMVTSGAFMLLIIIIMTTYVFQIKNLLNSERKLKDASVAKSIFLRETYHELRTPLNAIFGIAQLMQLRKDEYATEEERQEIDDLYSACYVARNIINNVLDMSRIDAGRFNTISKESLNLRECIEHCVIMNRYVANSRGVRIEYQADKELPTVILSDKLVLIKIINNLLSNAVKFSSMKSTVEIKTFWNSQQLVFQIKNRGVISKEKVAKIFEP